MRPNPLRERFAEGTVAIGGWLSLPSAASAEVMGAAGFDYVNIDMQHGMIDYRDTVAMLQAIAIGSSTPLVRVPWNEPSAIGKALDAGAMGTIVPMVNTRQECQAALAAGRYAPGGGRSFGPVRALLSEGADYFDNANSATVIIPMIETRQALDNLDEILGVEGVEAIYVGPSDLAVSMGYRPGTDAPEFQDALAAIVETCARHDVVPGIHATAEQFADRRERGFEMVTVSADFTGLRRQIAEDYALVTLTRSAETDGPY